MGLLTRILGLKAQQVRDSFKKKPQRVDLELPLSIRIGSTVEFDTSNFIIGADQMEFTPPQGRCICKGFSKLKINDTDYFRFYLHDDSKPARDFVLQVGMDEGKPAEFLLFQTYVHTIVCPDGVIYPATVEEWETWLDDNEGLIGGPCFNLPSETEYQRAIMPERAGRLNPFEYIEKGTVNEFNPPVKLAEICGMPYGRTITVGEFDIKEFVQPEKREDEDGAFITVLVGLELSLEEIRVL